MGLLSQRGFSLKHIAKLLTIHRYRNTVTNNVCVFFTVSLPPSWAVIPCALSRTPPVSESQYQHVPQFKLGKSQYDLSKASFSLKRTHTSEPLKDQLIIKQTIDQSWLLYTNNSYTFPITSILDTASISVLVLFLLFPLLFSHTLLTIQITPVKWIFLNSISQYLGDKGRLEIQGCLGYYILKFEVSLGCMRASQLPPIQSKKLNSEPYPTFEKYLFKPGGGGTHL